MEARTDTLLEMVPSRLHRADGALPGRGLLHRLGRPSRSCRLLPQWHYTHLFEDVFPYVLEHGGTQEQIDTMLVDVPRRFFEASVVE